MIVMTFCHKCSASVASRKGTVQLKAGRITFRKTALTHVASAVSKGKRSKSTFNSTLPLHFWVEVSRVNEEYLAGTLLIPVLFIEPTKLP